LRKATCVDLRFHRSEESLAHFIVSPARRLHSLFEFQLLAPFEQLRSKTESAHGRGLLATIFFWSFLPLHKRAIARCLLASSLGIVWTKTGNIPQLEERLEIVAAFAAQIRELGPTNFLYSDGDALFAHGDRRRNSTAGQITAPGLVYLQRHCSPANAEITDDGLSVTGAIQVIALGPEFR